MTTDPIPAVTVDPAVARLVADAPQGVADVKAALAAYKEGGFTKLAVVAPQFIPHIEAIVKDVEDAAPAVKAGYKTTEFWLGVAVVAGITVSNLVGHPLPVGVDAALAGLGAIYTFARTVLKK